MKDGLYKVTEARYLVVNRCGDTLATVKAFMLPKTANLFRARLWLFAGREVEVLHEPLDIQKEEETPTTAKVCYWLWMRSAYEEVERHEMLCMFF